MSALVEEQAAAATDSPALSNFRDFGGLSLGTGSRIVSGRLFRSAAPMGRGHADGAWLARHGIATVVDLRGVRERASAPVMGGAEAHGVTIVSTPVEPNAPSHSRPLHEALTSPETTRADIRDMMIATYRVFADTVAEDFGDAIVALLEAKGPALVHCTAGKDRTGFVVAVIQSALGAPRDAILHDYLLTNIAWDRASVVGRLPLDSPAVEAALVADADYLEAGFDEITRIDGSIPAFIARATRGRITDRHLHALIERREI